MTGSRSAGGGQGSTRTPCSERDRKAKRLKSLLEQQPSVRKARSRLPFIQPVVFLSHPEVVCKLPPLARQHVHLRDESPEGRQRDGIMAALTRPEPRRVDRPALQLLVRALAEAGIREARRKRQVGDYLLGELIGEGAGYQDFEAKHVALGDRARVRIFGLDRERPEEEQEAVQRAARREWELIGPVAHEGFDSPRSYTETETGPALIYRLDEGAERLDAFVAARQDELNLDDRLLLVRQLAETLDYAHRHGIVHRSLSPVSIDVGSPDALVPTLRIRDWHAGFQLEATAGHTRAVTTHAALLVTDPAQTYLAPEALSLGADADTAVDVFSFGTIAYFILTGRPPAATPQELADRAREGLSLSAVLDGVPESLELLVLHATQGDTSARPAGMSDVLAMLDQVDKETLTAERDTIVDPAVASTGDELGSGLTVVERLGAGATAYALLVERDGQELVLKIARGPEHNDRLRDEDAVLEQLTHACIVRRFDTIEIGDRVGLLSRSPVRRRWARHSASRGGSTSTCSNAGEAISSRRWSTSRRWASLTATSSLTTSASPSARGTERSISSSSTSRSRARRPTTSTPARADTCTRSCPSVGHGICTLSAGPPRSRSIR